jgi:transcriptional regulator with XRE-family HTH domain
MNVPLRRMGSARQGAELGLAITPSACDPGYPGTREELILVSAPPGTTVEAAADGTRRRDELADFLRTRRNALQPEDVGLPGGGRRRTPGLRREEVAQLAGVGATWYTWLEQARDVRASRDVLEALARALQLTAAERDHLLLLGRGSRAPAAAPVEHVAPAVRRLVECLEGSPAYVLGRRWDFLAWNDAAAAVFGDPEDLPPQRRNHVWRVFADRERRAFFPDWQNSARIMLAKFRADCDRHVGDPWFEELLDALRDVSPEFRAWWKAHEVHGDGDGRKLIVHPVAGRMKFEHAVFRHAETPEHRLILYSPLPDEDTPAKVARLVGELRARA